MNLDKANPVADAVLYEGHILYPYRPSARKNQVRWTFGGVHPRAYSEAVGGLEPSIMQVQCLLTGGGEATVAVRVRFLHLVHRQVLELAAPVTDLPVAGLPPATPVDTLALEGVLLQTWDEAEERTIETDIKLVDLLRTGAHVPIEFEARLTHEAVRNNAGQVVAVLERRQAALAGAVDVALAQLEGTLARLTVTVSNETPLGNPLLATRDEVMRSSLVSTHAVLGIDGGAFISLANPPVAFADAARACRHHGAWPVMIGEEGDTDVVLATPIILEDYPRIAPESETPLFDSGEIDEILLLRIMTMTDEEKAEARSTDPGVAAMLEAAETMTADDLMRMHGTSRTLRPIPGYG